MSGTPRGLLGTVRNIFSGIVLAVQTRLELAATELQEEREQAFPMFLYALAAFVLIGQGLFFLTVFTILCFWETHRMMVIGLFVVVYLVSGICALWQFYYRLVNRPRLFSATISELKKDLQVLQG